jgi:hypothetical protein
VKVSELFHWPFFCCTAAKNIVRVSRPYLGAAEKVRNELDSRRIYENVYEYVE